VTFGLLLFLLKKFAWKPLLSGLEGRESRIKNDLQDAENARREAEKTLEQHRALMQDAELEARRVIEDAKKMAEKMRVDILAQAEEQARQLASQAKAEIQREKDTALLQLRAEIADLAIGAASRILGEQLDEEKNRRIVDAFIADLPRERRN
jgi:F-type H+-transporting ATPase subunit b